MSSSMIAESVPLRSLIVGSQNGLSKRSGESGDEVAVLRLADISEGRIDESEPRRIRLSPSEREKYALRRGDLICIRVNGSRGLVGRIVPFTSPNAWAYCDHFIRLRPDFGRADHRYLTYYLNSSPVRRQLELSMVSSAGQHTVSQGTMLDLPVPLAALERQREIVAKIEEQFTRLDEAVANIQRAKARLRRFSKSVLVAAMWGDLAGEPETWSRASLGEIALSVRNGCSVKPDRETGVRILRISAVRPLALDAEDVRYLPGVQSDYASFGLDAGDLLFTRYNGSRDFVGVCAVVPPGMPPTVYPDKLIRVRLPAATLLPEFLAIAASTGEARAFIESRIRTTAGQAGISGGDLKALPVRFPSVAEQQRIVAEVDRRLSIVRGVEAQIQANLKRAQSLRQAVLGKAFAVEA